MIKKLKDFSRADHLLLLAAITAGEFDPDIITDETLFGFSYEDCMHLLMIASNQAEGSEAPVTICLSEAKRAEQEFLEPLINKTPTGQK